MDRGKMIYTELNGIRDGKTCGVFYRYLHRRLWNWLADTHGRKYKKDWPEWAINGGIVPMAESYCFACAATDSCSNCPIDWNYRDVEAMLPDMPYCYKKPKFSFNTCGSWIAAYTYTAGTYDLNPGYSERIARAIAEAPIKNSYRGRILEYDSDYMALKGTL